MLTNPQIEVQWKILVDAGAQFPGLLMDFARAIEREVSAQAPVEPIINTSLFRPTPIAPTAQGEPASSKAAEPVADIDKQHAHTMLQFEQVCHGTNCHSSKARYGHSEECKAEHDACYAAPIPRASCGEKEKEIERLTKDAARYQWLRCYNQPYEVVGADPNRQICGNELDIRIDEELEKTK